MMKRLQSISLIVLLCASHSAHTGRGPKKHLKRLQTQLLQCTKERREQYAKKTESQHDALKKESAIPPSASQLLLAAQAQSTNMQETLERRN